MITENIEIENSVKKAFEHIMKTKIGQDETIPDDILQVIHRSNSNEQNGRNIEIPLYDQLHQANVCTSHATVGLRRSSAGHTYK